MKAKATKRAVYPKHKDPALWPIVNEVPEIKRVFELEVKGAVINRIHKRAGQEADEAIEAFYNVFGLDGVAYEIRQSKLNYLLTIINER